MKIVFRYITVLTLCVMLTVSATAASLLTDVGVNSRVYAGGVPFGIRLYTEGLVIVKIDGIEGPDGEHFPALDAGLVKGDVITEVNGVRVTAADDLISQISSGSPVVMKYLRCGSEHTVSVTPYYSEKEGRFRTGMWLRDSAAGIGTLTFVDPADLEFAGLGHGVCDSETGRLVSLKSGAAAEVKISGVKAGVPGDPGELRGTFSEEENGSVDKNTGCGVFGKLNGLPCDLKTELCPIGSKNDIREGKAKIICTTDGEGPREYDIEIRNTAGKETSRSFELEVTDKELISRTGGIVQGMSGSPVIQDGLLVGAVTHVMINDPTRGYGIYIEDMLSAAKQK